jgi:hypothetical protein
MRLVARINHQLGIDLRPREVFERPTIAEQAERIDRDVRADTGEDTPAARELRDFIAGLLPDDVNARLADWQTVALDVRPSTQLEGERRALFERLLAQHDIDLHPSYPLARRAHPTAPSTWGQEINYEFHERRNFLNLTVQATAFAAFRWTRRRCSERSRRSSAPPARDDVRARAWSPAADGPPSRVRARGRRLALRRCRDVAARAVLPITRATRSLEAFVRGSCGRGRTSTSMSRRTTSSSTVSRRRAGSARCTERSHRTPNRARAAALQLNDFTFWQKTSRSARSAVRSSSSGEPWPAMKARAAGSGKRVRGQVRARHLS